MITKAVFENFDEFKKLHPAFANLDPKALVDEAFLRRIRYKIGIEAPSVEQYDEIFKRICTRKGIDYKTEAMSQILAHYRKKNLGLRSCHPRDIVEQLIDPADDHRA